MGETATRACLLRRSSGKFTVWYRKMALGQHSQRRYNGARAQRRRNMPAGLECAIRRYADSVSTLRRSITDMHIASGDIRNVVKAIASLPLSYNGKPLIIINDMDFHVVARNVVMLLLALSISDHQEAAEAILHCWYSALLPLPIYSMSRECIHSSRTSVTESAIVQLDRFILSCSRSDSSVSVSRRRIGARYSDFSLVLKA